MQDQFVTVVGQFLDVRRLSLLWERGPYVTDSREFNNIYGTEIVPLKGKKKEMKIFSSS